MKNIKLSALIILVACSVIILSSCTKEPTQPSSNNDTFSSSDFELIIMDDTESEIEDCDDSNVIVMLPAYGYSDDDCKSMGWEIKSDRGNHYGQYKHMFKKHRGNKIHLGIVLRNLKLTTEQVDSIKLYIIEHINCVTSQMLILRASERAIIDSANRQRLVIIDSAKAQGWTYEQLRDSLKTLNQNTRLALKDNPVRLEVCLELKACRQDLFSKIELILTPDQYLVWLEWKSKLPEIKCGN